MLYMSNKDELSTYWFNSLTYIFTQCEFDTDMAKSISFNSLTYIFTQCEFDTHMVEKYFIIYSKIKLLCASLFGIQTSNVMQSCKKFVPFIKIISNKKSNILVLNYKGQIYMFNKNTLDKET